jgi:membrane-associated phospholipid phosphatase
VFITVGLAIATTLVFVFVAYGATRAPIQRLDDRWLRLMVRHRSPSITRIADVLNVLGYVYITLPVRAAIAAFLAWRRRWWHFASFLIAIVVAEACIGTLKSLYDRPRPPGGLVGTTAASFPSGHAIAASVTVVAAVIALIPEGRRRYAWGAAAVGYSFLMALSRAYLGSHWLSDAVAGVLLGTTVALGTAVVLHRIRERPERRLTHQTVSIEKRGTSRSRVTRATRSWSA